ncbi:MAG: 5'/3'-nucleotidase SurE [Treponema sp.]|nr:5'/3'-nucleotidase SurE [Treponema sp.]
MTNDDGFDALGINVLRERLLDDNHEVYVMAPATNQSGTSQSISMGSGMKVREIDENLYACAGSPADCVMTAIHGKVFERPDMILSGINRGPNLGLDILYSGTCGAARQGVLLGIPSAALSVMFENDELYGSESDSDYEAMADFAAKNLKALKSLACVANGCRMPEERCVFANVNGMAQSRPYKGGKYAGVSFREYVNDKVSFKELGSGLYERIFTGGKVHSSSREYSDYDACVEGYAAVSRIFAEPTAALAIDGIEFKV